MAVLPVADARARLSRLVESAVTTHERTTITRNGVPAAVLLSVEDYESMQETIEVLADPGLMAGIKGPLLDNPQRVGRPLDEPMAPAWSARRGEYRVIYLIDDGRVVVEVVTIVHRRDADRTG
jgi:prevent-host-death family protein